MTRNSQNDLDAGATKLLGGDCNDNDIINIGDLTQLLGVFRNTNVSNAPGAITDINTDTRVNIQDLTILGRNYGISGTQNWP